MGVRLILKNEVLTAVLSGEIDHHSAREIRSEIDSTATKVKPKKLALDFSAVSFMDSSGIGLVMGRYKAMQAVGGEVYVENTTAHIKKVMKLAGLDRIALIDGLK